MIKTFLFIGFTGYAINNNETGGSGNGTEGTTQLGKSYFKSRKSLLNSQYTNSRQVTIRMSLERGQILVLPVSSWFPLFIIFLKIISTG